MSFEKLTTVKESMKYSKIPVWVMYCVEESDPYFKRYISSHTVAASIAILCEDILHLIVHDLDADNFKDVPEDVRIYNYQKPLELESIVEKILNSINFPENIFLNYTTLNDTRVDQIGHGIYLYLTEMLNKVYSQNYKSVTFHSAEKLIYALCDRKNETTIKRMEYAANRALQILETAFTQIKPGMTEIDVMLMVKDIFKKKPGYFAAIGVVKEDFSWEDNLCPTVLTGPSLQKGGHANASQQVIEKGFTIYFDFGVKFLFEDGEIVCSDIQRMGYVLRDGETTAPKEVQAVFDTLIHAIDTGIKTIRPGLKGYEIDQIVRSIILEAGYPSYNHGTGHAVGEYTHNPGTRLAPDSNSLACLDIQPHGVYTIEPRIAIHNGGSIEEMVLVTENGGRTLCTQQRKLYLIG